jgi:hypothetical protein
MTKTYHEDEFVTIHSVLKIEFVGKQIILEHQIETTDFEDDDSSIFLCFNPKETKNLFVYYETDNIEDLFEAIHHHFKTYNSLRRYQDFFFSRDIHSTISSSCALTD